MKKLFAMTALVTLVAACSNDKGEFRHHHKNPEIDAAIKACHQQVGEQKDFAKFESCMKEKGIEMPKDPHHRRGPHHDPEFKTAAKACHQSVGKPFNAQKFDACMNEKGFKKPDHHPHAPMPKHIK